MEGLPVRHSWDGSSCDAGNVGGRGMRQRGGEHLIQRQHPLWAQIAAGIVIEQGSDLEDLLQGLAMDA